MTQQETENTILNAARAEFIEFGFKGARMQAIADRAGLNKALLHYYFRSKEKLYAAALGAMIQEVLSALQASFDSHEAQSGELDALLETIARGYMGILRKNPDYVRLIMRELADGGNALEPVVARLLPVLGKLREILSDRPELIALGGYQHMLINMFSLVAGTFVFQPWYSRVLPMTGMKFQPDDAFYETRIRNILCLLRGVYGHA